MMPFVCLVLAMLLWASTFVVLKIAFRVYDPMVVIFGRMFVASLCAIFVPWVFRSVKIVRRDIVYLVLMILFEPCLYFIFEAKALLYTSAAQAGMITSIMPMVVAVAAWFFLGESVSLRTIFGLILAIVGAIWLSLLSTVSIHASNPLLGNFLEFIAMLCAAGYAICLKKISHNYSPLLLTFFQAFGGAIFFFPTLFFPGTQWPDTFRLMPFLSIAYLGIAVSLGAFGLYNYAISKIEATKATAFVNLIPVFTLIFSALILGEWFTLNQYLASAFVIFGVLMSQGKGWAWLSLKVSRK